MLETNKLQKLEREAHQWVQQALPNLEKVDIICPQMKRLIDTAEEQNQFLGPNMEKIAEVPLSENHGNRYRKGLNWRGEERVVTERPWDNVQLTFVQAEKC